MTTQADTLEVLSAVIHQIYCDQYLKDHQVPYWTGGDYSKLDEKTKEYDRNIARFIMSDREEFIKKLHKTDI